MALAFDNRLRLDDIGAPLAVLDDSACVLDATPSAAALIARFQLATALPAQLPADLARELASTPFGCPIIWRPRAERDAVLGCTRYALGDDRRLLLMREITEQQRALSQRMHRQRLEETGWLAAQSGLPKPVGGPARSMRSLTATRRPRSGPACAPAMRSRGPGRKAP